jgi:hypothetical protein
MTRHTRSLYSSRGGAIHEHCISSAARGIPSSVSSHAFHCPRWRSFLSHMAYLSALVRKYRASSMSISIIVGQSVSSNCIGVGFLCRSMSITTLKRPVDRAVWVSKFRRWALCATSNTTDPMDKPKVPGLAVLADHSDAWFEPRTTSE